MTAAEVRLSLPADADYAGVARLTAAGVAARSGCGYDDIEDIRIAVGEACSMLIGLHHRHGSIEMVFEVRADALAVEMCGLFGDGALPSDGDVAALSDQILAAVVDDYEYEPRSHTVRFCKNRVG